MGEQVETLADLFPDPLRAVGVGINPAPTSVAAGHYYQGSLGQRFWARLAAAGILRRAALGSEDDAAVAAGFGFTEGVKRPTARADSLTPAEVRYGAGRLREKLAVVRPPVVVCVFRAAAVALTGVKVPAGWWDGGTVVGAALFAMPGPYEAADRTEALVRSLAGRLAHGEP